MGTISTMFANITNITNTTGLTAHTPASSLLYNSIVSFLFPFLLVFAIVYGVLERSKIFEGKKDIESIIAFVLGIIFATTSYTLNLTYLILPIVGIVAVIIFMLLILASMVYGESASLPDRAKKIIVVMSVMLGAILILWVLVNQNLTFAGITQQGVTSTLYTYGPYVTVLIFLVVVGYILSGGSRKR
jgi:small-conductance mechanosensitive channel